MSLTFCCHCFCLNYFFFFFFFFMTHNRGGPSPQGGLIPRNGYNTMNSYKRRWKLERSEVRLDMVSVVHWFGCKESHHPLLPFFSRGKRRAPQRLYWNTYLHIYLFVKKKLNNNTNDVPLQKKNQWFGLKMWHVSWPSWSTRVGYLAKSVSQMDQEDRLRLYNLVQIRIFL